FVEASKSEMSEQEYQRIRKKVEGANGDYKPIVQPSEYTGFRSLSTDKVANVVRLIISTIGSTFVTKMNKLLFYADFIHYKNHGYGITGITYKALPFGPVPKHWGTLYSSLPGIDMEEFVYPSGQSGIKLEANENTDNILNESELSTIEKVCALFSNMNAGEISQTSHLEKGWIENKDNRSAISYQDAFALNYG
ncbi:MAG: SocA family protein, partial [Muribaculaceae bacterium]|nr:SocA family protein [Muribaculaceae bacterium]